MVTACNVLIAKVCFLDLNAVIPAADLSEQVRIFIRLQQAILVSNKRHGQQNEPIIAQSKCM